MSRCCARRLGGDSPYLLIGSYLRRDTRIVAVEAQRVFLVGGGGIVAQLGDAVRDVRPPAAEGDKVFVEQLLARLLHADGVVRVQRAEPRDAGLKPVLAQREID